MAQSRRRGGSNFPDWEEVSPGYWRNRKTGEYWRGWRQYGPRAGHYPGVRAARGRFRRVRAAEAEYARNLRRIARHVGDIVRGFIPGISEEGQPPGLLQRLQDALADYARLITPWAHTQAERMLAEVARRDAVAWIEHGKTIGRELRREIEMVPLQSTMQAMRQEQVDLITSLPRGASERVHEINVEQRVFRPTVEGLTSGARWTEVAKEIFAIGGVTRSRANLIARTETGRAATTVTKARAEYLGSPGYVWRSVMDADTRPRHRKLDGQFILWNEPPIASEPGQKIMKYHAGAGPNCRCWAEPVLAGEKPETGHLPRSPEYTTALEALV
jgi:SPP1 gp7 family putative phage head morphogenesis protein